MYFFSRCACHVGIRTNVLGYKLVPSRRLSCYGLKLGRLYHMFLYYHDAQYIHHNIFITVYICNYYTSKGHSRSATFIPFI